ncbi:MAG: GNAT family N-acetyltransferase [Myxococcota bacterium]
MQIRTLRASDLDRAFDLDADAFHVDEGRRESWKRFTDPARFVGAFEGERLLAMTGALGFGQFFGGRAVPMGGLSSVAVVPDARGRGIAKPVIRACVDAMRERGEVISTLFPATTGFYRSLGWEVAGSYAIRKVLPRLLRDLPRPDAGALRPGESGDRDGMHACYASLAAGVNGCLDRPDDWWERLEARREDRDVYVHTGVDGTIDGYLVYRQLDGEFGQFGGDFSIAVDEWVATGRDASLALWRLLAGWATQVDQIVFHGPVEDPLLLLLPEQVFEAMAEIRWMTRVIDAAGAVAARGFPAGLDVEVPLRLVDPECDANDGAFVLTVQKGRARLARGAGDAGPQIAATGFASLYTGWATTADLARAGVLYGGSDAERAALDAAFAGPTPWLLDEF